MAVERLVETGRPRHFVWPLSGREAAQQKLPSLLREGDVDGV